MMIRALFLALSCACAAALSPLVVANDDSDCALYLTGPGRSSAYDYSINLLKGNFGYDGQQTCITYDAVNQAYLEARNRILVSQPKGDWKPEDYASVGELVLDISINLARRYGLTYEEVEKGLPLIDTSRTLIREVCPPVFSHVECRAGKYRRFDGLCNNLQHPTWGATNSPFQRLIGPLFSDGINAPRISHSGRDLPLSRVVSRTMHPDDGFHDHAGTVMVIAWGQFMDHDYTLTGTPLDPLNRNDPEECCKRPPHLKHPYCNEIRIPDDDYFYRLFGVKCIDFVRAFPSPRPGCRLGSRVAFNTLTGVLDGNTVYGVTEKFARKLRTGFGGLLRMNPVFKDYGLKDLLPLKLDIPDEGCTRPNKNMYCFEAGEIRVNEQLVLTVMHTLMAREHNRVAKALSEVNPHWDDETLFQEARRINIAEIQHITFNEFLPILLGKDVMDKFGLVLEKEGYWDGYDAEVNPDVIASFAAAAYRFGHSLLPTAVERWSKAHKFIASKRLSDLIRRPYDLYRAGVFDEYVMGLMNQVAQAMDDSITQEVTNHLFKKVGARFGMDLVSFNMQRGREFGIPGYMEFRKFCGLPGADTFQDLFGYMSNHTVRKYETIFEHPVDVDLWSGGVSERPLPGSMLGPTFACIIATQFSYSRRGDRFWFELPNQPSSFTPAQLAEIRKSRLARVICDNTDIIDTVQLYPMVLPDHELNPRVPCRSGIIPGMDFSKWAEPTPFHGPAKHFITQASAFGNNQTEQNKNETEPIKNETDPNNKETVTNKNETTVISILDYNCDNVVSVENENSTIQCNNTTEQKVDLQVPQCNTSEDQLKIECANNSISENITTLQDCAHNDQATLENCKENKKNEIPNSDTILKYVYKKGDKVKNVQKSTGHEKNSLKRRKRSALNGIHSELLIHPELKSPLIVNYETLHGSRHGGDSPVRNAKNNIKTSALADFNIETVHANNKRAHSRGNNKPSSRGNYRPIHPSGEYRNTEQSHTPSKVSEDTSRENEATSDESDERVQNKALYRNSNPSSDTNNDHSGESLESSRRRKRPNRYRYPDKSPSAEFNDSNEQEDSNENTSRYSKSREQSDESSEKDRYTENLKSTDKPRYSSEEHSNDEYKKNPRASIENSNESSEGETRRKPDSHNSYKSEINENKNSGAPIQDVDLEDFSYERIQVNEKGEVEPAKDNHQNVSSEPIILQTTTRPTGDLKKYNREQTASLESGESSPSVEKDDSSEPVSINDGEVKPVIETNSDSDNIELSEKSTAENSNDDVKDKNESLETLLGVKTPENSESDERSSKIAGDNTVKEGDVKQEFERIPKNYNHHDKPQSEENGNVQPQGYHNRNIKPRDDEGTLDVFTPKNDNFDEHLKTKFADVTVKLPEIKLPEDILAYAREEPTYTYGPSKSNDDDDRKHPSYHYYNNDNTNEKQKEKKKTDDDAEEEPAYYGYYGNRNDKQAYKKEDQSEEEGDEEEEEDEDLYEKFVRERFGKSGSFQKRSEKLEDINSKPQNPQLYATIQNILKKTEEVRKEAEMSGDPKAGYMWTLEYGENA